jgi:hypothetical protein
MAVLKLESSVQSLLVHDVTVVAGVERIGTRLADRATPSFLPFAWLPANHPADQPHSQPDYPMNPDGMRAGRPGSSRGSRRSRCLPRRTGATRRPRGANVKRLLTAKTFTRRAVSSLTAHRRSDQFGRSCRLGWRRETWTRPVM